MINVTRLVIFLIDRFITPRYHPCMEMVHFIPPTQRRLVILAAQADTAPVLICGASGTGKGAIAQWIHRNGPRAGSPMVEADHDTPLVTQIPAAQGGTLLVPELAEWPLAEQMTLLKFLKSKTIKQENGLSLLTNIRVIATSSPNIDARAQGGLFNSDLLEALSNFRIEMPSLADRIGEFEDIVLSILSEITSEVHREHLRSMSREAWSVLRAYDWPGNIRELRNVLKIAVLAARGDEIEAGDLPEFGHDRIDFRATREQFEKIYLMELLKTFDWQIDRTCRMARMDKTALLAKIDKYGIRLECSS
jgi:two-component system response regulator HydG